jgi:hypothetical protein
MSPRLEQVIEQMRALPEPQQDALAEFVLYELAEDARWGKTTEEHADKLKRLTEETLNDDAANR